MQHFKLCNFLKCSRKARWTGVGNTSRIYIESWWKKFRWHSRPKQQGWRRSSAGHPSSWPGWACRSGASSVWWWGSSSCLNPCGAPGSHPCSYHRVEQPMWPESHTPASTLPADRGRGRTNIPWCADTLTCLNVPNPDRADIVLTTDWQCTPSCSIFVIRTWWPCCDMNPVKNFLWPLTQRVCWFADHPVQGPGSLSW